MKSTRVALLLLIGLLTTSVVAELALYRQAHHILEAIDAEAPINEIEARIRKGERLIASMLSHEDLREVEIALCDYRAEPSKINKSRLRDSVHHVRQLSFFSYFQKD